MGRPLPKRILVYSNCLSDFESALSYLLMKRKPGNWELQRAGMPCCGIVAEHSCGTACCHATDAKHRTTCIGSCSCQLYSRVESPRLSATAPVPLSVIGHQLLARKDMCWQDILLTYLGHTAETDNSNWSKTHKVLEYIAQHDGSFC